MTKNLVKVRKNQNQETFVYLNKVENSIWFFFILVFLATWIGMTLAALDDHYLSFGEAFRILTLFLVVFIWLCFNPKSLFGHDSSETSLDTLRRLAHFNSHNLDTQHLISQEYILPYPYLSQIYHLLNLKHLETVHGFSLNNLKVLQVSHFQKTRQGGKIRFQTFLDSPLNILRLWRRKLVEVELILRSPYQVELRIPVSQSKVMIVLFSVLPISQNEHKFFVDIYSNLDWPKPLLQIILHFSAFLTLFEDLPYLGKLSKRNLNRFAGVKGVSEQKSMLLFQRFVDLYGSPLTPSKPAFAEVRNLPSSFS